MTKPFPAWFLGLLLQTLFLAPCLGAGLTNAEYIALCRNSGIQIPSGPLPLNGPTAEWKRVADFTNDQLASPRLDQQATIYQYETNDTLCLAMPRSSRERSEPGKLDHHQIGVLCYNKLDCRVCALDGIFKPDKPATVAPTDAQINFPFNPNFPADATIENCAGCHSKGPILSTKPVYDALKSRSIQDLVKTCEGRGGPTWVGSGKTTFTTPCTGPNCFCSVPQSCKSCHTNGILKPQVGGRGEYCSTVGKTVFNESIGAMTDHMIEALQDDRNVCQNLATCLGCGADEMCPSPKKTVSVYNIGGGRVVSAPPGIDCDPSQPSRSVCAADFKTNSTITLSFVSSSGGGAFSVTGASNASCGLSSCTVKVSTNTLISVTFGGNGGGSGPGTGGNGGGGGHSPGGTGAPQPQPLDFTAKFFRLFNPVAGFHFFTTSLAERNNVVVNFKWRDESNSSGALCLFNRPQALVTDLSGTLRAVAGQPVFRLYNPNAGFHFYTLNRGEAELVERAGWRWEKGKPGGSAPEGYLSTSLASGVPLVPISRFYNLRAGYHLYTTHAGEISALRRATQDWREEGILGYGSTDCR